MSSVMAKHDNKTPGSDQPGFEKSRRINTGDIDQIDGNSMSLPVDKSEPKPSAREGTSGGP